MSSGSLVEAMLAAMLLADPERLLDTFLRVAGIDSPSLHEGVVAAAVRAELDGLGWEVSDDGTGPDTGNLIARWPGNNSDAAPVFFCSHLDVVEPCRSVQPQVRDGIVESDGTTVLGADAKVGVAVLMEAARVLQENRWPEPLELVLTWGEEVGHLGAKAFDRNTLRAAYGFVLDALSPVGTIITSAPGYDAFTARIRGRAAHAGVEPERGISAIAVAARAIDRMPWGRLDEITTANIGRITGGSVRNAVPELVELAGEVRSLDPNRLAVRGQAIRDSFDSAAAEFGATVEFDLQHEYRGYGLEESSVCVEHARRALSVIGGEAHTTSTGGGSDANEFNAAGLECCVLGIGAENCHSVRERVAVAEIVRLAEWVLAIVSTSQASSL